MQAAILSGEISGIYIIGKKNGVSSVSSNLHRDQPELSRYANYLTIIYLEDSYAAFYLSAIIQLDYT